MASALARIALQGRLNPSVGLFCLKCQAKYNVPVIAPVVRRASAKPSPEQREGGLVESQDKPFSELSFPEKVKQTGKDASYVTIIIAGVAVTGAMFYFIGRELFSGDSVNGVYTRSVKLCTNNPELQAALGSPIKGYGETTKRGRRRYPSHLEYEHAGIKYMRMKFYVEGPVRKGTAHLEMQQMDGGHFDYRYLFVELNGFPAKTVVIEDKR